MKKLILFLFAVNIAFFCLAQPKWYPNAYKQYDDKSYIVGTASSKNRIDAEQSALSNLSNQINVRVKGDGINILNYSETQQGFRNDREIKLHTTLTSDINLINAKMVVETKKGNYYALALIEINRFIDDLSYMIIENERRIDDFIRNADIAHGSLRSISFWRLAYQTAMETEQANRIRTMVSKNPESFPKLRYSSVNLLNTLERFTDHLTISVNMTGDVTDRVKSAFTEVFTSRSFKISGVDQAQKSTDRFNRFNDDTASTQYMLNVDFKVENLNSHDPEWKFVKSVLIWTFEDSEGKVLLSSEGAIVEQGGGGSVERAREASIRKIESNIKESGFADIFDKYINQ